VENLGRDVDIGEDEYPAVAGEFIGDGDGRLDRIGFGLGVGPLRTNKRRNGPYEKKPNCTTYATKKFIQPNITYIHLVNRKLHIIPLTIKNFPQQEKEMKKEKKNHLFFSSETY